MPGLDAEKWQVFRSICDDQEVAVTASDPALDDVPLVYVNDAFLELTGYAADEVLGRNCRFLQGPDMPKSERTAIRDAIKARRYHTTCLQNFRKDGTAFFNLLVINTINFDADSTLLMGFQYPFEQDLTVLSAQMQEQYKFTDRLLADLAGSAQHRARMERLGMLKMHVDSALMRSSALSSLVRAQVALSWFTENLENGTYSSSNRKDKT